MTDYIKREDAIEFVESLVSTMSVCINKDECVGMNSMKKRAIGALHDVPAADVRENKHEEWINNDQYHVRCSNCKHEYHDSIIGVALFCPRCGAIMDGGDAK